MTKVLHRITYDASLDDAVDVAWRLANRSQAFQKQIRLHTIVGSLACGLIFFVIWGYLGGLRTQAQLALALAGSVGAGLLFLPIFRRELVKQVF